MLQVSLCADPRNGTAVINNDGSITYTPYAEFSGSDSLCYTICDNGTPSKCDDAKVYITVMPAPTEDNLVISRTLTPKNKDGINDVWAIEGIEAFPDNRVKIFNRWGDVIYEANHYNNTDVSWDGTYKNNEYLPDGTYYYILEIKGHKTAQGWIYITSSK